MKEVRPKRLGDTVYKILEYAKYGVRKTWIGRLSQWWGCLQWAKKKMGGMMDAVIAMLTLG